MIFTPKTEEELQMENLLPEGIYPYQVIKSEDKVSQAGNQYTSITLKVWDKLGGEHLVFTNMALVKLLKHFCDVNDMKSEYQSGNIHESMFLGKCGGRVCVSVEGEKPNPKGGMYKAKNIVKDYIPDTRPSGMKPLPEAKGGFVDDSLEDLPF